MKHRSRKLLILGSCIAGTILYGGFLTYKTVRLTRENRDLKATTSALRSSIEELKGNLSLTAYERDRLTAVLDETQQSAYNLYTQTEALEGKVNEYEKLHTLDPELLKKYSKVYFLNEHYVPSALIDIDSAYVSGTGRTLQFHADAYPFLISMLADAETHGFHLKVASAYRSFGTQESLKAAYKVQYGSGANRFSADQGYSEHQLGTTADLTTAKTGTLTQSFDATPEYKWLTENAYHYGFVLSYPKGNAYYMYEPWHWRFVGVALATDLHDTGKHLYDLDQRDIDEYLLHIFD